MTTLDLAHLIEKSQIKDLEATTKREALLELIDLFRDSPRIRDLQAFRDAILAREELTSTGIGLSVAIPHAKIPSVDDYVVAVGRCRQGVEFDSLDNQPVQLIFMVGASDRQVGDFVRLLAQIVNLIKNRAVRLALLEAQSPDDLRAVAIDALRSFCR